MAAKIIIKRRFHPGNRIDILSLLSDMRSAAMSQPGYISGMTLSVHREPQTLIVIGSWASIEHWHLWRENPERKKLEALLEVYQELPAEYTECVVGSDNLE